MISLKRLEVEGFRGIPREQEFNFDQPATLVFAENHQGKSSVLNAIEWAFFGDDCVGLSDTGLRERIGWEVVNRRSESCRVVLELETEDGDVTIKRTLDGGSESLEVAMPDGATFHEAEAQRALEMQHRSSFRDFLTTVYQHQEAIRSVVTDSPKERNDAIDRLLGLTHFKNFLDAVSGANVQRKEDDIDDKIGNLETKIETTINTRKRDLEEARGKADDRGLSLDGSPASAMEDELEDVVQELSQHVSEAGLDEEIEVPEEADEAPDFISEAKTILSELRSKAPEIQEQQQLYRDQDWIQEAKDQLTTRREGRKQAKQNLETLQEQHGTVDDLESEIASKKERKQELEEQANELNERRGLVNEGINLLKEFGDRYEAECPLCGQPAENLLDHLETEYQEEIESESADLEEEIAGLEADLQTLRGAREEIEKADRDLRRKKRELSDKREEIVEQLAERFDRELAEDDDPLAVLDSVFDELEDRKNAIKEKASDRQSEFDEIDETLEDVRVLHTVVENERRLDRLDEIQATDEFQRLRELQDELGRFAEDVNRIEEAMQQAVNEAAREKIEQAESMINETFLEITEHPSIDQIEIDAEIKRGTNSYEFRDGQGRDLVPVLSQGDLNALALSIFLALSESAEARSPFSFVMMDDPTQSMGPSHKQNLVRVLNDVLASGKDLVLATMEEDFQAELTDNIQKQKRTYRLSEWSPKKGPAIAEEPPT